MKKNIFLKAAVLLIVIAITATACVPTAPVAASGPTFARGVVTAKGSVTVHGIRFDTSTATVIVDRHPSTEAALQVGMLVNVKGTADRNANTGTASLVEFENSIIGPVDVINLVGNSITVLGQVIIVDTNTDYQAPYTGLADVVLGDVVEISGDPSGGRLHAAFIQRVAPTTNYEIDGTVSALDNTAGTLTLTPQFSPLQPLAVVFTNPPLPFNIDNTVVVEINFPSTGWNSVTNTISVDQSNIIVKPSDIQPSDGDYSAVEGSVYNLAGSTFLIDGISIQSGSLSLAGVGNGSWVDVEGNMAGGILYAKTLSVR